MKNKVVHSPEESISLMTLLKRHRLALGLTQKKLGERVGRSTTSVSEWESGKTIPEAEVFPKLARVLGIPPMELTRLIEPTDARATASN